MRLIQSGLISKEDLARKYSGEIYAIEIVLLAYYIASANIEIAYNDASNNHTWKPFQGIVLGDTFQMTETGDTLDVTVFQDNNARAEKLRQTPIQVIIGNPPYSAGQRDAMDNAPNQGYPTLDARIRDTYVETSTSGAKNFNSLYDSYIRGIRWASDRLGDQGVVGYVTNAGFLDSNAADGLRRALANEFSDIYVYNMRGDARTSGEQRRKERGNVFGEGTRTPVAAFFLVKDPNHTGPAHIRHHDIGDYLTRDEKLAFVEDANIDTLSWQTITPNKHADWLDQRNDEFATYQPIGDKGGLFNIYSAGAQTNRDAWVYSFSADRLTAQHKTFAETYAADAKSLARKLEADPDLKLTGKALSSLLADDPARIKWTRDLRNKVQSGFGLNPDMADTRAALYRPFTKQLLNTTEGMIYLPAIIRRFFPEPDSENLGIYVSAPGSGSYFSVLAVEVVPDLCLVSASGQFFPRYTYREVEDGILDLDGEGNRFERVDNITDQTLEDYREHYGHAVTKDDIFYYVYGLLHSPTYRKQFAIDLTKDLPRIPKVTSSEDFWAFTQAGRELAELHIGYENVEPYPLTLEADIPSDDRDEFDYYRVERMRNIGGNRSAGFTGIKYNNHITITDIPIEAHDYMLGSRSALGWLFDRYQVTTHKASGIVNDPNDWAREVNDPRYILDLIGKVTTVSLETNRIVAGLPELVVGGNSTIA